ncbi:MAG TPA: phosphatase PAP2 family protein [Gemmatimonadaceae bacterium]|nr:phosphatase PAP2 family protein [Gemmatimonadaceae bacterium]
MIDRSSRLAGAILFLVAACSQPLFAQKDTVTLVTAPFWLLRDWAIIGAFGVATVAAEPLDKSFAERLQNPHIQENRNMRRVAHFVENVADPGAFIIGASLYTYGRVTKHRRIADLGLHGTEALFIGSQIGWLLKGTFGRQRPFVNIDDPSNYQLFRGFRDGGQFQSFPSGHSIAAFAAASAVTSEIKLWQPKSVWIIGPLMYGGAATVAWSRMFDNKHWASDVITGAAIGTFSGLKVVHWHHKHPNNAFDRFLLGPVVVRTPAGDIVARFRVVPELGPPW